MSARDIVVPEETRRSQSLASDPANSAWVSANAGSGKTHVLAQRVIRLLLDGTEPSRILCLTYTKAAAANMSNRVFRDLARWTTLDEAELRKAIASLDGREPDTARLVAARRLFARALETPGGLKIQTIHAFCEAVLHQFPLEANIAGHFEMLDGQAEQALVAEARRDILTGLAAGEAPELVPALEEIIATAGEDGLNDLIAAIVAGRDALRGFIDQLAPDHAPLFEEFGFSPDDDPAALVEGMWPDSYFDRALAEHLAARAAQSDKKTAETFAKDLLDIDRQTDPLACFALIRKRFVEPDKASKEFVPRSIRTVMAKGVAEHFPEFPDQFARYASAVADLADRIALLRMLRATRAAMTVADRMIGRYEQLKSARGFLDFNDLITRTVRLLARADAGAWVAYKLDRGIDHILVDEAQDTSPLQWQVVSLLTGEFFAGKGMRDNVRRTVFAVGDEKQSIYSFQGADPASFRLSGRDFQHRVRASEGRFEDVKLRSSFRSTLDVLAAVDLVFSREESRKGLTGDPEPVEHSTVREFAPGHVEVWPLVAPVSVSEPEDWSQAIDHASAPAVLLAERIARTLRGWIDGGEAIGTRQHGPRRVRPGDVLVLVRKRDRFIHALTRALKNLGIAVAGADRLSLPGHIAVKDLIAIGRVALQPHDDLSLAALLRSPVFGLTENRLFDLAHNRPGTLLDALRAAAEGDEALADIVATLDRWANEAALRPVFEFYGVVLARDGVRSRLIARLGPSAGEIIDEFQNFTLAVERTGLPGLEAFIATVENAGPDIKREMDQSRDEVRIMTVHAAKGLEAPVVFLVDGAGAPSSETHLPRLLPIRSQAARWQGQGFLWRAGAELANSRSRAIGRALRDQAEDEYRRLLYVGMTRAEERLIVCGYRGARAPRPDIWHEMVRSALAGDPRTVAEPDLVGDAELLRFRVNPPLGALESKTDSAASAEALIFDPLPPVPEMAPAQRALSPSGASALLDPPPEPVASPRSPVFDPAQEPSFAIARGLAIHRLLQVLPSLDASEREAAAARYLDAAGSQWPEAERAHALRSVAAILDEPRFAPVFAPGSRAEVAITGHVAISGVERVISGVIDRLAVTPERIMCVDYKTNRPPPAAASEVPEAYLVQMALYRALLSQLYSGREVVAALLFTETPQLIELPADALDDALERLMNA